MGLSIGIVGLPNVGKSTARQKKAKAWAIKSMALSQLAATRVFCASMGKSRK